MSKNFHIFLSVFLALASAQEETKRYRRDYVYNSEADAFYKLHIEFVPQPIAKKICDMEDAQLMMITSDKDKKQLHSMLKEYPDLGRYVWVGDDGLQHESAEEEEIDIDTVTEFVRDDKRCEVMTRTGEIESLNCYMGTPFICKVDAMNAPYNDQCNVFGKDYIYNEMVGSCYRISQHTMTWNMGYNSCRAQGSHLVVLNSAAEQQVIFEMLQRPPIDLKKIYFYYFVGGRADKPVGDENKVFTTIFNQTLDEAGYNTWSPDEPDNLENNDCGALYIYDGQLNDVRCTMEYGVICEIEVPKQGTS